MIRGATCFSGIGAPEAAAPHFDWLWSAEVEPFPAAVHANHYPHTVNLGDVLAGDFLNRARSFGHLGVLVGGPPCQAFSVAGKRGSLDDARGNRSLRWVQIIHATRPDFVLTENVPGWLSTKDNAFGCFLGALVGADGPLPPPAGASWPDAGMASGPLQRLCWRILDAQYFGVPQRRRRVFVVSCPPDGHDPAAVLFEPASLRGDSPPSREAGQRIADTLTVGANQCSGFPSDFVEAFGGNNTAGPIDIATVNAHGGPCGRLDFESETFVTHTPGQSYPTVAFTVSDTSNGFAWESEIAPTVQAHPQSDSSNIQKGVRQGMAVRRLLPIETERLQGLPDDYTAIVYRGKPAADGNRYRAIGNSMAVPCIAWILRRLERVATQQAASRAA